MIKKGYYYLYYTFYKAWSKNYNPVLSNNFKADICIIALKIWFLGVIDTYLSVILKLDSKSISITSPKVIIALILVIGSTLFFLTFSDKWKPYFEEFEKWSKRKRLIGSIIAWAIVVFIFINVIFSVELMKKLNG